MLSNGRNQNKSRNMRVDSHDCNAASLIKRKNIVLLILFLAPKEVTICVLYILIIHVNDAVNNR